MSMSEAQTSRFSCAANMMIENARPAKWVDGYLSYTVLGLWKPYERWLARRNGGLAVGGRITFDTKRFTLKANAANRLFNEGDLSFSIETSDILGCSASPGFLSGKLDLSTATGVYRFRCWSAKEKAEVVSREVNMKHLDRL